MKQEELKTLRIDVENGIYEVNGRDISGNGHKLDLTFENGIWSLMLTVDNLYSTSDHKIKE